MAKEDLYSFDDKSIDFNTSDLDDIINNDDVMKNFKEESKGTLIFDEDKQNMLKEEPVLDSLDALEHKEKETSSFQPAVKSEPLLPDNDEKVLFSDESGAPVALEEQPMIVEDKETEKFVQEEISREMMDEKGESTSAPVSEEKGPVSFFEEDEDETISLSSDELSNILEDTEDTSLAEIPTVEKVLGEKEETPERKGAFPGEAELKEGPIEGGEISLDEIPVEDIDLNMEPSGPEGISAPEMKADEKVSSFFEEDEDESIGLTDNELDNILKSSEIMAEPAEEGPVPITEGQVEEEPLGAASEGISLPGEETETLAMEGEEPVLKGVSLEEPFAGQGAFGDVDKMDQEKLKKIFKYLDNLLDYLPEEKIKEFAKSEYYDLYHSLFNDLKI